ncbi:pyridoxamine 5'-phosphate oxidase family protein [Pseudonocardia xishanensis]|uniref:Pyridoxamine 5'-phosphate oxidase n=1 Tax=Pseudonocardia xishanensis TaxID=630995 RepID=A0ABP8RNP7_9PSEU
MITWSDEIDEVLGNDLAVALAYRTPAGGAVAVAVAPIGMRDREAGTVSFTTSLGLGRKLDRIRADPRVALTFHTRRHGLGSVSPLVVQVQGTAEVVERPSAEQARAILDGADRHMGISDPATTGFWGWWMREYYAVRVPVVVSVSRITTWPDGACAGESVVLGEPSVPAGAQEPPAKGTEARVDVRKAARRVQALHHQLLAVPGADGLPTAVPVQVTGADEYALEIRCATGLLPTGPRRAGLLAHDFHPQLVGLTTRYLTGWLEPTGPGSARYLPHTDRGYAAPPNKTVVSLINGGITKLGVWQARRRGTMAV